MTIREQKQVADIKWLAQFPKEPAIHDYIDVARCEITNGTKSHPTAIATVLSWQQKRASAMAIVYQYSDPSKHIPADEWSEPDLRIGLMALLRFNHLARKYKFEPWLKHDVPYWRSDSELEELKQENAEYINKNTY